MSFLFGSAPKVTTPPPQSTTNTTQQNILNTLAGYLQSGATPPGVQAYTGQFAAPQTAGQSDVIQQLLQTAGGLGTGTGGATSLASSLPGLVSGAAGYQAPQIANAPQIGFNPQTPTIDPTAAFQQGVVNPVTSNFLQTVIPQLNAGAGRSAGGIYSSDAAGATDQALTNLNQTLTGAGAQYALGAAQSNQAAQENTNALLEQIAQANQGSALTTNALNTQSALAGQGLDLSALSQAPGAIGASYLPGAETSSILESLFPTISTPQTTEQTQLSGEYQDFLNQILQGQNIRQLAAGLSTTPTQQTNTVVQPGQTGLIPGALQGLSSNAGVGLGLMSLLGLSDERAKEDLLQIGRLDKSKLPVYTFRYKGEPDNVRHIGLVAQEVEQVHPKAVGRLAGTDLRTVNYATVALEEMFPAKRAA